ncbi:MAG: hypothetical protein VYA28_02685 [Pseudomonadota bacterium]|nr:hypothetical protein [Pseudomonadota bacterium]
MHRTRFTTTFLCLLVIFLASVSYGQNVETINYANGDVYVGEVRNGELNGQGTYTNVDGDVYVGEFRNGQYNGQGTFTFVDGRVSRGIWHDNELITESDK